MYRLIVGTLLGLSLEIDRLRFAPVLPKHWKAFTVHYRYRETRHHISLSSPSGAWLGPATVVVDGETRSDPAVPLLSDRRDHRADVRFR
jgi:cellobiose phosphorylase